MQHKNILFQEINFWKYRLLDAAMFVPVRKCSQYIAKYSHGDDTVTDATRNLGFGVRANTFREKCHNVWQRLPYVT